MSLYIRIFERRLKGGCPIWYPPESAATQPRPAMVARNGSGTDRLTASDIKDDATKGNAGLRSCLGQNWTDCSGEAEVLKGGKRSVSCG